MIYTIKILKDRILSHQVRIEEIEASDPKNDSDYEFMNSEIENHRLLISELQSVIKKII